MKYYDLKNNKIIEEKEAKALNFLYNNFIGRVVLKIMTTKLIAKIYAKYMNSTLSKLKIKRFIKKNNINIDEYIETNYKSFNDFFMRKIRPEKRTIENGHIAICDAKLSVYKIDDNLKLNIKNSIYTVEELIQESANKFKGGYACVYRLSVDDYHHYIYPSDGEVVSNKKIKGKLHTVQPIALKKYKVFSENSREVTTLNTKDYGIISYIEVGAMLIGKIVNTENTTFKKGQEKGHFEFGGSTIIVLFQKDKIKINRKILYNTKKEIETIVKLGMNLE